MKPRRAPDQGDGQRWSARPLAASVALVLLVALCSGLLGYVVQAAQNRGDARERFSVVSKRVARQIVERMHRYEYGLRGARGVAVAADGQLTREQFSRYAASRQIDKEFPGARGFGIVLRVPERSENDFLATRRRLDAPDFILKRLGPTHGDRLVITFVEPADRNHEALGLDIGSEASRRSAALMSARSQEATLTAPLTLVQASTNRSGGLLLLLPIYRPGPSDEQPDMPGQQLVGWSYAPLLIEEVLQGLDAEDAQYQLALYDLDFDATKPFFSSQASAVGVEDEFHEHVGIPLYGRRWEAALTPTPAFFASLHPSSAMSQGLLAMTLGAAVAALMATLVQLADRTRGHRLELARRAAIVQGSADAIIVQTLDGVITDWNEGAERLFGYSKAQAKGQAATALLLPADLEAEDADIRRTVAQGQRVQVFETLRLARGGVAIPVSITASPIRDDAGAVVGSAKILRDVRDAKAAEQRMKDLNASLERQVRERTALLADATREARDASEAKSRFLANISHEIRTPMNAVIGMTHLLGRTRLDADQSRMVALVNTAGRTLLALINDVLDLSKIEASQMTLEAAAFRLRELITEVASMAEVSARQRGIDFVLDCDAPDGLSVIGDRTRIGQIVLNLLTNAIKFTARGAVTLTVRVGAPDASSQRPITIKVTDTGIGIPAEVQARLFQPFVQADSSTTRRFGGTGLGLSIVRQLVDLMDGTIALRSRVGKGSEFEVDLRLLSTREAPARGDAPVPNAPPRPSLAGRHLLVVDDNELNREIAGRLLREEGAVVSEAANGREAVERLSAPDADFDAVLMDVQMPVMDGLEATRSIRESRRWGADLRIIGLTAGVSAQERATALAAGMNAVLGKPFDPAMLAKTVAGHLSNASARPPRTLRPMHAIDAPPTDSTKARPPLDWPDWPDIATLDRALSFRRLGGNLVLLQRMVRRLVHGLEASKELLASTPDDAAAWRAHAAVLHDFKSMAGTLGGSALQAAADAAHARIAEQAWADALVALRQLTDVGRALQDSARRLWGDRWTWQESDASTGSGAAAVLESGDLASLLDHLST